MFKTIALALAFVMSPVKCSHGGEMPEEDKQQIYDELTKRGCDCQRDEEYCLLFVEDPNTATAMGFQDIYDACESPENCFGRPAVDLCKQSEGGASDSGDSSSNTDGSQNSVSKCHKAPSNMQKYCHSSTECKFDVVKYNEASDGINLSGCVSTAKGTAKLAKGNACAGYSDQEIQQKTEVVTESVGAGKFTCGVYIGQLQDGEWTYSFSNIFGDVNDEKNTCFELVKKKFPEHSANFCKQIDPADATYGHLGYKRIAFGLLSLIVSANFI